MTSLVVPLANSVDDARLREALHRVHGVELMTTPSPLTLPPGYAGYVAELKDRIRQPG